MIIVEDGSNVANANSYVTIAELKAYALARGTDLSSLTDEENESLLIKAMDYLEGKRHLYKGYRANQSQILEWPRHDVWDLEQPGVLYSYTSIPRELTYAQMALAIEANTNDLQPNRLTTEKGPVIREKVGEIEVAYSDTVQRHYTPGFSKADALLAPLMQRSGLVAIRT